LRTVLGIAALVLSTVLFPLSDTLSKALTARYPGVEIAWIRYAVLLAAVLPFILHRPVAVLRTARPGLQLGRGAALAGATALALTGFIYLPVADATAIAFCAPLIVTALAAVVLREAIGAVRWIATAAGFLGVLIVVQPGGDGVQVAALLPLASSVFSAITIVLTRLGRDERIETTLIYSTLVGFVLLSGPTAWSWRTPDAADLLLGIAMGSLAAGATLLQLFAYRCASASLLAPFSYAQIVIAIALGWAVGSTAPSLTMLAGSAVVIASGAASGLRVDRWTGALSDWLATRREPIGAETAGRSA
jgi:drug/metabolite transporter (DMT)-like permease